MGWKAANSAYRRDWKVSSLSLRVSPYILAPRLVICGQNTFGKNTRPHPSIREMGSSIRLFLVQPSFHSNRPYPPVSPDSNGNYLLRLAKIRDTLLHLLLLVNLWCIASNLSSQQPWRSLWVQSMCQRGHLAADRCAGRLAPVRPRPMNST